MRILPGHTFHRKSDAELRFIIKDAGEAATLARDFDAVAEAKYSDQVNDAASILYARREATIKSLARQFARRAA